MKNKKIILGILVICILAVFGYYFYNLEESKSNVTSMENLVDKQVGKEDIESKMKNLEYKINEGNMGDNILAYSKDFGNKVDTVYSATPVSEYNLIYIANYNDASKSTFIMIKSYKDIEVTYSPHESDKNLLRVEVSYYNECSVNCDTTNSYEIRFEHYTYNIEEKKLENANNEEGSKTLKDFKSDIDIYFEELSKIY